MKQAFFLLLGIGFFQGVVLAQNSYDGTDREMDNNQNLRYVESQEKYARKADSLISFHQVTVQNTYKAYDWREAKAERKAQRRLWRHEERMVRPYYYTYPSTYDNYYNRPYSYYRYSGYSPYLHPRAGYYGNNIWLGL